MFLLHSCSVVILVVPYRIIVTSERCCRGAQWLLIGYGQRWLLFLPADGAGRIRPRGEPSTRTWNDDVRPDPKACSLPLVKLAGAALWKISNIRSSRIVLSSRSVYLIGIITLRQLRYLSALARHAHFGRSAQACSVT